MDKKILMLGLMLSGNVFGMDNRSEILNDYHNLSEQTKREVVSKDQINDILAKFDLHKSDTGEDLFSSVEKEEYDIQIKEDISDDIYAQRRHDKFLRGIEKARLTSSYEYYYGDDESLRAEFDDRNSKMIYDMVFKAASLFVNSDTCINEDELKRLVKLIKKYEKTNARSYASAASFAISDVTKDTSPQWQVDRQFEFREALFSFY